MCYNMLIIISNIFRSYFRLLYMEMISLHCISTFQGKPFQRIMAVYNHHLTIQSGVKKLFVTKAISLVLSRIRLAINRLISTIGMLGQHHNRLKVNGAQRVLLQTK